MQTADHGTMGSQRAEQGEADGRTREAEARRPRDSLAARFRRHLARPVDAASLGAFRFWFGLCIAIEVLRFFAHGWIRRYYIEPVFTFALPGFGFLRPWPGGGMYLHFAVLGLAGLAVMLGFCYRLAIAVLFLAFTYVFALEEAHYQNHFYLIALLGFLLMWMPADRWGALRLSAFRRPRATAAEPASTFAVTATVPNWTIFLLRAQLFIVYFYAGIAKLNSDWLQGQPMAMWLAKSGDVPVLGPLLTRPGMVPVFAYGGLLYDLSVPFLLAWPRTRAFGLIWTCCFHLLNAMLFQIGIFPWLAMGATLIFAAPDWPRRALRVARGWIRHRPASAGAQAPGPAATVAPSPSRPPPASPARLASWGTTALVSAYLAVQLLVPLRHWLYPGDVAWTEEGHILSWRMKLRDKEGQIRDFAVIDPRTEKRIRHHPRRVLTARQYGKMVTRPRMLLRYVHWLADRHQQDHGVRPRIHADVWASLNGRRYQQLIDPRADLAAAPLSLLPSPWIVPLRTPLSDRGDFSLDDGEEDE